MIADTLKERGNRYGKFEDNARITQSLLAVLKTAPSYNDLTDQHLECLHMIFHKVARAVCGDPNYVDNFTDIAGYAVLMEEILSGK